MTVYLVYEESGEYDTYEKVVVAAFKHEADAKMYAAERGQPAKRRRIKNRSWFEVEAIEVLDEYIPAK